MRTTVCRASSALICLATLTSLVSPRAVNAAEAGAGQGAAPAAAGRLNVLFLMTDEHHYRALSLAGCPYIQTPNLDRIGREGAWFTNATCVTPYCSPSRASLMAGCIAQRVGMGGVLFPRNNHGAKRAHQGAQHSR